MTSPLAALCVEKGQGLSVEAGDQLTGINGPGGRGGGEGLAAPEPQTSGSFWLVPTRHQSCRALLDA